MGSLRGRFFSCLRSSLTQHRSPIDLQAGSRVCLSTTTFDAFAKNEIEDDDFLYDQKEIEPQGVDPRKGWGFRGVHKAIICGKIGQAPVQKILRNGKTITIFTVGTGGMFDQRIVGNENLPRPAQWHRITVHNETLGAYSVQQLAKNSAVFVEGDIETRVYNDSITGQVKNVPEICVRRDGKVRLIKSGDSASEINLNDLRNGIF
ncbi:hypothetical protein KFK09_020764 [Dendrobium nobile]|uniref:Single-stranded DNA-binding protein, mitochondrial n=1 Tax=Dendrobium nobile TaxID=94219 RepID=A0A8T3AML2_DENNO|nr:hypothetical protein KFK09_020764 [Dendrobium nobile]